PQHAEIRPRVHCVHARLGRLAGHQRLYRRIPGARGRLQDQHLGRLPGDDGDDPQCDLYALSLSPADFRHHHPRRRTLDARPQLARGGGVCADDRGRALDGHLPVELPPSDATRHRPYRSASRGRAADAARARFGATLTMPIYSLHNFISALPEIFLAVSAMALLMLGVFQNEARAAREVSWLGVVVLVIAIFMVGAQSGVRHVTLSGMFITDAFSIFAKIL